MKVALLPDDESACGFYRMTEPVRALREQRPDLTLDVRPPSQHLLANLGASLGLNEHGQLAVVQVADPDCDVIVLQRPFTRHLVEAIPLLQAHGTAVVVELDDALDCLDVDHPMFDACQPQYSPDWNWRWLRHAIGLADMVTVTTDGLAATVGHDRVTVIPNYIPAWYLDVGRAKLDRQSRANEVPVIGWYGTVATHPGDLDIAGPAIRQLVKAGEARFHGIGDEMIPYALGVQGTTSPWGDIRSLPYAIAAFDIGIAPLKASAFNDCKSWLKPLEMAACGVPLVMSSTAPYLRLADMGVGLAAPDDSEAWRLGLGRFVKEPSFRRDFAERAWKTACSLTMEIHAVRWLDAWVAAVKHREAAAA